MDSDALILTIASSPPVNHMNSLTSPFPISSAFLNELYLIGLNIDGLDFLIERWSKVF